MEREAKLISNLKKNSNRILRYWSLFAVTKDLHHSLPSFFSEVNLEYQAELVALLRDQKFHDIEDINRIIVGDFLIFSASALGLAFLRRVRGLRSTSSALLNKLGKRRRHRRLFEVVINNHSYLAS